MYINTYVIAHQCAWFCGNRPRWL